MLNVHLEIYYNMENLTTKQALDYEIRSSWWASWIWWSWGQELAGSYFAWKTAKKMARYKTSKIWEQRIKNY